MKTKGIQRGIYYYAKYGWEIIFEIPANCILDDGTIVVNNTGDGDSAETDFKILYIRYNSESTKLEIDISKPEKDATMAEYRSQFIGTAEIMLEDANYRDTVLATKMMFLDTEWKGTKSVSDINY